MDRYLGLVTSHNERSPPVNMERTSFDEGPSKQDPTLEQFILSAQRARPDDFLIWRNGVVEVINSKYDLKNSKEIHERTWQVFHRAVVNALSKEKINRICREYKFDTGPFNSNNQKHVEPLQRHQVEFFGVGCSTVYTSDLIEENEEVDLSKCTVEELGQRYNKALRYSFLLDAKDPRSLTGGPQEVHEFLLFDHFSMDKRRSNLYKNIDEISLTARPDIPTDHVYYSRLSMAIISLLETARGEEPTNLIIPAPAGPGKIDFYKVHQIISDQGLTAVALNAVSEASSLPPLIAFRCTKQIPGDANAFDSLMNDMQVEIGKLGYEACENDLKKLMDDPTFTRGEKVGLLGYSLGGAHVTYCLRKFLDRIKKVVIFNAIGAVEKDVEDIANQINSLPNYQIPPPIYLHDNDGDWANYSGKKRLGWGITHPNAIVEVYKWDIHDLPKLPKEPSMVHFKRWGDLHSTRPLETKKYDYKIFKGKTLCDELLDTYRRDPLIEDSRTSMLLLASIIYHTLDFFFRLFGIDYFRTNVRFSNYKLI